MPASLGTLVAQHHLLFVVPSFSKKLRPSMAMTRTALSCCPVAFWKPMVASSEASSRTSLSACEMETGSGLKIPRMGKEGPLAWGVQQQQQQVMLTETEQKWRPFPAPALECVAGKKRMDFGASDPTQAGTCMPVRVWRLT